MRSSCSRRCSARVRGPAGWTEERSGTHAELTSLWIGNPTDVHVVGSSAERRHGGVILHHDGEGWTRVPTREDPLRSLWGTGQGELYAVGGFSVGFGTRARTAAP